MRHVKALLIAGAALAPTFAAAVPIRSTPSLPIPAPAAGDMRATLRSALERAQAGDCAGALGLLDPLVAGLQPGPDRTGVQLLRLPCLAAAGRASDAQAAQTELAAAVPDNALVRSYGVMLAAVGGRFAEAAQKLEAIATEQPKALELVSGASWGGIAQKLTEARETRLRGRVSVALARAAWEPADRPDMKDGVAQDAIRTLLADKQASEAELLLARIDTPELLAEMATERAYAPLWPAIEARMGAAQGQVVDRFAAARLDAFARADDPRARRDAVRAFVLLGRLDDAIELAVPVKVDTGMDDDDIATVRYQAQAMAAKGQRPAAIARLEAFAALDLAQMPRAASGLIQLAEMLDEADRPADALRVAQAAMTGGKAALSPWGMAWLRRTEVCALSALKRPEAAAKADALAASAKENEAAAVEGLLCAGRMDDAARIAVATLSSSEGAARIVDQFQPSGSLWAAAPSRLRSLWVPLLARADVKAAFDKTGRILPKAYWPAPTPRPIPRAGGQSRAPTA
ncbi:hypothetical protein [Sphingomonas jatrophae]|uniref:Tetratricopeptide repeat-containing protein n=1 Tax=Sphingomonas jatrophae TaxID=1166337 RepID=A0A1I6JFY4_9SPHN|nr:hypothetical protein [Sphingomonas jatrophae]SFR77885.1 hypothetical protein SAMN05192580_0224 [Sphingomonas jatrophae]